MPLQCIVLKACATVPLLVERVVVKCEVNASV